MTEHHKSWITLAQNQATRFGNKPAYIFLEDGEHVSQTITYSEMDCRARSLAARLQDSCEPGDRVMLVYDSCVENMIAFFSCLYAGLIAVPMGPLRRNRLNERFQKIAIDCQPSLVLSADCQMGNNERYLSDSLSPKELTWLTTDTGSWEDAKEWQQPSCKNETLAFLQYTSGSTGVPKGVAVSHGNLLYNQAMMQEAFKTTASSTIVSWLPIFHDMGLIGQMLHAFYVGATCIFMPPMSFLQQPFRWLKAISTYRAEISGGPNFSYNLCRKKICAPMMQELDLSSWRVALNGAEPVQRHTLEEFSQHFAVCGFQKKAFYPGYGMAEATLIISGDSPDELPVYRWLDKEALSKDTVVSCSAGKPSAQPIVGCGGAVLEETIVVVDVNTLQPCSDDRIGEIWVAGKHIAQGYWGRPEATRDTFQAYLCDGRGPFLRTGDLGFLKDGILFVTGRLKDVIILQGRKHYPQDIEASIQSMVPAVQPDGVVAVGLISSAGEHVVVIAEMRRELRHKTDLHHVTNSIRQVVSQDHGLALQDVVLIRPGTLPKTTSGKVQRRLCGDLYRSEGFRICHRAATHEFDINAVAS